MNPQSSFSVSRLYVMALSLLLGGLMPALLSAGTQNIDGVIHEKPSEQWDGSIAFRVLNTNVIYQTRDFEGQFRSIDTINGVAISSESSLVLINGRPVSIQTFTDALDVGMHGHFYEQVFLDAYLSPDHTFGVLQSSDPGENEIQLLVPRTPKSGHYVNNPDDLVTVKYSDEAEFFIEDSPSTAADALAKLGKWVQVHPPREQLIWLETEASAYDDTRLPHYDVSGRGTANSASGLAFFGDFREDGSAIEVTRYLDGEWAEDTLTLETEQAWLDGKLCPPSVALKPGREFTAGSRRGGTAIKEAMIRTRDDEIRGTITAVDGDTLTVAALDWDRTPYTTTLQVATGAKIWLDGIDTDSSALEAGLEVRFFPERTQKRIVVLNERRPGTSSALKPVAYFHPDKPNALSSHEFTLDASHSYDLDGHIVSYEWDLGGGDTATGAVVTHTFDHGSGFKAHRVALTVTDDQGDTDTHLKYITVVSEMRQPENLLAERLQQGMVHKEWEGCDYDTYPACGDPDTVEIVRNTVMDTNGGINEFSGYLKAPEDGWYEFRVRYSGLGRPQGIKLYIGDWLIKDADNDYHDDWGPWNQSRANAYVYLEKGFHRIRYLTTQEGFHRNLVGWSGPGVSMRPKTIDEIYGNGSDTVTKLSLVWDEDTFYLPSETELITAFAAVDQKQGVAPLAVSMNGLASIGDIDLYEWRITEAITGDSVDVHQGMNHSFTFNEPGLYDLSLEVGNTSQGFTSTDTVQIVVQDPAQSDENMGISISFSNKGDLLIHPTSPVGAVPLLNWNNYQKGVSEDAALEDSRYLVSDVIIEEIDLSAHRHEFLDEDQTNTDDDWIMRHWSLKPEGETLVFSNIPQTYIDQGYDVYIYPVSSKGNTFSVTAENETLWIKVADRGEMWNGEYVRSFAESQTAASGGAESTHVVFENLTSDQVRIDMSNGSAGFAGIQIVTQDLSSNIELDQTIQFFDIEDRQITDGPFALHANASSDLLIDFSMVSGPASVSGNTVTLNGQTGIVTLKAEQVGNDRYNPAESIQSFLVTDPNKSDQTLTVASISDKTVNAEDFSVAATATSGLPVNIEIVSGPAVMVDATTVSLEGTPGEVIVKVSQEGDGTFNPAPIQYKRFTVFTTFGYWMNQYDLEGRDPYVVEDGVWKGGRRVTLRDAFLLGDHPLDANDYLRITDVEPEASEGSMRLYFQSLPGRQYTMEVADDLVTEEWNPYGEHSVTGDGAEYSFAVPMDPGDDPKFYRVQVRPAE